MSKSIPAISVIVCTYNGAQKIEKCLEALKHQSFSGSFEIIVVNDGSKDETQNILNRHKGLVTVTNKVNLGLAGSRNVGVGLAKGEMLVFTDDDCIADKHWLRKILSYYEPNVDAVGGKIIPYATNHWLLKYYELNNPLAPLQANLQKSNGLAYRLYLYFLRSLYLNSIPDSPVRLYSIVGANMSMRKSTYTGVGSFDSRFRLGGEDEDFWKRYHETFPAGCIIYGPDAVIRHDYLPSYRDALRRNREYGLGNIRQSIQSKSRPIIYPFPILIFTSLIFWVIDVRFSVISWLFLLILYPGWLRAAILHKRPQYIFYAFIQLTLEMALNFGVFKGYFTMRNELNI